jgi:hypothetical protein
MSWAAISATAGSTTQVIYNSSGTLTGSANLTFDGTTNQLTVNTVRIWKGGGAVAGNIAIGPAVMNATASGGNSIGIGNNALTAMTSGANNNAFGAYALNAVTTGTWNTALGVSSLETNLSGSYNVAIGVNAGSGVNSGSGNTIINPNNSSGTTAPVFSSSTANDRVVIGSTGVTNAYVQVAWTVVSDARDKTDFQQIPHGLSFVQQLNPVSFYFKKSRESDVKTGIKRYGFKAQEILALEDDDPVIIDNEDSEKLRYNGEALVPVLVKAIQELSAANETLTARIAALEAK